MKPAPYSSRVNALTSRRRGKSSERRVEDNISSSVKPRSLIESMLVLLRQFRATWSS
jgi:hypothetical protein